MFDDHDNKNFIPQILQATIPREYVPPSVPAVIKKFEQPLGAKAKKKFLEYITEGEVHELVEIAKAQASSRPELLKFLLEQVFGKAPQSLDLGDGAQAAFGVVFLPQRGDKPQLPVKTPLIDA